MTPDGGNRPASATGRCGCCTPTRVAAAAREDAAAYSPAQMIEPFSVTGPNAIATARQLGSVVVDYFGRAKLPLVEAVSIGILGATVHLWTCSAPWRCHLTCLRPVWSTP